ncbi:hypothetical protein BDZ89DRAFT_1186937 [Hymenopellis radicata]|nr:hypothetical protein BDZ89DRAFT_1186937 [Hymenopellis radicata]
MATGTIVQSASTSSPSLHRESPTQFILIYMRKRRVTDSSAHIPRPPNHYLIYRMYNGITLDGDGGLWGRLKDHQRQPYLAAQEAAKELQLEMYPGWRFMPTKAAKGGAKGKNKQQKSKKRSQRRTNRGGVDSVSAPTHSPLINDDDTRVNGADNSFPFPFTFTAPMPAILAPMQPVQQGYPLPPHAYAQATSTSSWDFDLSPRTGFSLPTDYDFTFTAPMLMPNISHAQFVQQGASPVPYAQPSGFHDSMSAHYSSHYDTLNAPAVYDEEGMAQTSDANPTVVEEAAAAVDEDTEMAQPGGEAPLEPSNVSRSKNFDIAKFAPYLVDYAENAVLADLNDALDIRDGLEGGYIAASMLEFLLCVEFSLSSCIYEISLYLLSSGTELGRRIPGVACDGFLSFGKATGHLKACQRRTILVMVYEGCALPDKWRSADGRVLESQTTTQGSLRPTLHEYQEP